MRREAGEDADVLFPLFPVTIRQCAQFPKKTRHRLFVLHGVGVAAPVERERARADLQRFLEQRQYMLPHLRHFVIQKRPDAPFRMFL